MAQLTLLHDWIRLKNGFDVEFRHGVPVRMSDNGLGIPTDDAQTVEEISSLSGLTVTLLGWHRVEESNEQETRLCIDPLQFEEVLQRLALSSAFLFVDRYHTCIDSESVDWDNAEYARDFNQAVEYCGLETGDVDKDDYFKVYATFMHAESNRIMDAGARPLVESE